MGWFVFWVMAIFGWYICGIYALDLHKPFTKWMSKPGNPVRVAVWMLALTLTAVSGFSAEGSVLNDLFANFVTMSITVIAIDELVLYRNRLQRKQEIIEQIGSRSNDFALEAVRLARKHGWLEDGALVEANLRGAELEKARLTFANLKKADFGSANLRESEFGDARLEGAKLWFANLEQAKLPRSNLTGANLHGANLKKAFLIGTNLKEANLEDAQMNKVYLFGANLKGASLKGAKLEGAKYDENTKWPDGFDPDAAGAVRVKWDEVIDWIPVKGNDTEG